MLGALGERLASFAVRRSAVILIVAAGIAVLSAAAAMRLRLNPEMIAFLPANSRAVVDFRRIVGALGTIDHHIVMITIPKGQDASAYEPLVENVAAEYQKLPFVDSVELRLPSPEAVVHALLPQALLLLTPDELELAAARLSDAGIRESMARNRMMLQTPQSVVAKDIVRQDPLRLRDLLLQRARRFAGGMRLDMTSRYLRSADGTTYLIVVRPRHPAQDILFVSALMRRGREIERRVIQGTSLPPPRFDYAGGYAITDADAELIRVDMVANVLFSFFGVLLLFLFVFRRTVAILYAALPMLLAIVATFGVAAIFLGELGSASAGFAALLAGLGIDFTTVLYGRFLEERNGGANVAAALHETLRSTLPGVIVAAVTTAATFYGFLFTDFRGMAQMGFLTGTGILLFLLAVAFVFPALAVRLERDDLPAPRMLMHVFGSARAIRGSIVRPRVAIALWVVFTVLMGAASTRLVFSDDAGHLRARGNRGIVAQQRLARLFGRGGDPVMIVAEAASLDDALDATERLQPGLESLRAGGRIAGFEALASILPSPARQWQRIDDLHSRNDGAFDARRIETTFRKAAIENGFRPEIWSELLTRLRTALNPAQPLSPVDIADPWLQRFAGRFVLRNGDRWMSLIYVHPPGGRWRDGVPTELRELVSRSSNVEQANLTLTGVTVVSAELRHIARADAARATTIGTIIVLVILMLAFGSLRSALLIFVPFLAGLTGMFGIMAILGLELNLMNIFIGLMLVGVATDYAVYMLQRFRESPDDFDRQAPETGKAVIMAALTAIVGYGSFAFSHYPGLQSIGYAATLGIGLSATAAITLFPAMLKDKRRRYGGEATAHRSRDFGDT